MIENVSIMNYYAMTDSAILSEIGARIVAHRLSKNITQEEVAQSIGVGRMTYNQLENGKGKLSTLVATLRYLDCLDSLDAFLPTPQFSPIAARKLKGKEKNGHLRDPRNL
jgi:putative transcriptional regulator